MPKIDKPKIILSFFIICCFANLSAALLIHLFGDSLFFLVGLKDAALFSTLLISLLIYRSATSTITYLVIIAAFCLIFILTSLPNETKPLAVFSGLRQIITVLLIITLGQTLADSCIDKQRKTLKYLMNLGLAILLIGIVERFTHAWSLFIKEYFLLKNIGVLPNGYPFILIEPLSFFNEFEGVTGFLRASSTFLDPINFGHVMVFWYFLADELKTTKLKPLFAAAVLLSFSKAAILQLVIVILFRTKRIPVALKALMCFSAVSFSLFFIMQHAGFESHQRGLTNSLSSLTVFGLGLGEAGNVSSMYDSNESNIGDSFIGALIGQIGVIGSAIWFILIGSQLYRCWHLNRTLSLILVSQLGLSILTENSFNFLSLLPAAFMCGYITRSRIKPSLFPSKSEYLYR